MDTNIYENIEYTNKNIQGVYSMKGKSLVKTGLKGLKDQTKLLLLNRKNTTSKKTSQYLLDVTEKKAEYISSLYATPTQDVFRLEYLGVEYTLDLTDKSKAVIENV